MTINYESIKHRLQPPLDCSNVNDVRGQYFHNRIITNYENTDFSGCLLYHCFPRDFVGATEVNPAQSKKDLTLKGANLQGAMLNGANLEKVDLSEANLQGVNLHAAWLKGANLQGANLKDSYLESITLSDADLRGADLRGANLEAADLQGANLEKADLRGATLWDADCRGANLIGAVYNSETDFFYFKITKEQKASMVFVEDED